jgi:hypothetical protein
MNFQWLANPSLQFGILVAGLFGPLVLFLYLKFELSAERRKSQQSTVALSSQLSEIASKMAGLQKAVTEMEERPPAGAPGRIREKRAVAVRMHMRGESAEAIAAGLRMPRSGVDLLLRIQEMMKERTSPAA